MENIYMTQRQLIDYLNLPSGNANIYKILDTDLEVLEYPCWTLIFIKDNKLYDTVFCHYDDEAIVECIFKRLLELKIEEDYNVLLDAICNICGKQIHLKHKITCSKINEQFPNVQLLECGCKKVCNMALYNIEYYQNECQECKYADTEGWNCEEIIKDNYDRWDEYLAPYYKD